MENQIVNSKNLFLKLSLHRSARPIKRDVSVNWHVGGGDFRFNVGASYLPVTLIMNKKGSLTVETARERFRLDNDSAILLNAENEFRLAYESPESANALFVFFGKDFVNSNLGSQVDNDFFKERFERRFFEKVIKSDLIFGGVYDSVINDFDIKGKDDLFLEEKACELFGNVIRIHNHILNEAGGVPLKKKAARLEVYRRLCRAAEYIESSFAEDISLDDIAKNSAISKYHFLRLFKGLYGVTPYEYIVRLKMNKAKDALRNSDESVSEICSSVGYRSLPTFSHLFKKHTGMAPQSYRSVKSSLKKAI